MTVMKTVKAQPEASTQGGDDAALRHAGRGDNALVIREVHASTTESTGEWCRREREVRGQWCIPEQVHPLYLSRHFSGVGLGFD